MPYLLSKLAKFVHHHNYLPIMYEILIKLTFKLGINSLVLDIWPRKALVRFITPYLGFRNGLP
jgi:hypothetical protein